MTAEMESTKTEKLSWRGSANRSINILKMAFKHPIQHLFVFPRHNQTDGALIPKSLQKQFQLRKLPTKIMLRIMS